MDEARRIIEQLGLAPHPEGGWYRETWRGASADGGRGVGTAILFLLEQGARSHWHRVDAEELWFWHAGSPIELRIAASGDERAGDAIILGGDVTGGEAPQCRVPAHCWQSAEAPRGWALVSCAVVPAFDFAGFELAAPGWAPGGG
ncbi:cupin domain-containing protein [Sphingomonas sp. RS6]